MDVCIYLVGNYGGGGGGLREGRGGGRLYGTCMLEEEEEEVVWRDENSGVGIWVGVCLVFNS